MPDSYYDVEAQPEQLERRAVHRAIPSRALPVQLLVPGAAPVWGTVAAMSSRGLSVALPLESTVNLAIDQIVELSVGADGGEGIVAPARAASARALDEHWAHVGFEFILVGGLHQQLERFFLTHFNRRAHVRAAPLARDVVRVQAQWPGGQLTARVHDLSTSGLALSISTLSAVTLIPGQVLALRFRLPAAVRSIAGAAEVRYVAELPSRRVIGLAYDLSDPQGLARERGLIEAFVAEHAAKTQVWDQSWAS
jgi:hypothetical protein